MEPLELQGEYVSLVLKWQIDLQHRSSFQVYSKGRSFGFRVYAFVLKQCCFIFVVCFAWNKFLDHVGVCLLMVKALPSHFSISPHESIGDCFAIGCFGLVVACGALMDFFVYLSSSFRFPYIYASISSIISIQLWMWFVFLFFCNFSLSNIVLDII